jgi:hypothetical protein
MIGGEKRRFRISERRVLWRDFFSLAGRLVLVGAFCKHRGRNQWAGNKSDFGDGRLQVAETSRRASELESKAKERVMRKDAGQK